MATKIVTKNSSTASAVPTASDLVQGELAVNVADKRLFTEDNAGAIVELGTNPYNFTANHNGSAKLATTSTGIDVTGTATMDGLTVDKTSQSTIVATSDGAVDVRLVADTSLTEGSLRTSGTTPNLGFYVGGTKYANIADNGDISFYEDTGTTAKFFWDASAESLGIGTSSPAAKLHTAGGNVIVGLNAASTDILYINGGGMVSSNGSSSALKFGIDGSERMRIDSSGNVGIGKTPNTNFSGYVLQLNGGSQTFMSFGNSATGTTLTDGLVIGNDNSGADIYQREAQPLRFHTSNTERMRIDSAGNLLVGKTATAFSEAGVVLRGDSAEGLIQATRANNECIEVNRTGTDGAIAIFAKDGASVGSIGAANGDLYLDSTGGELSIRINGTTLYEFDSNLFYPKVDNSKDLGHSGGRWKDLYLSGRVAAGAGSSGTPTFHCGGDTNTGINLPEADRIQFITGGNERARIDASGNLLVGTTSQTAQLTVNNGGNNYPSWLQNSSSSVDYPNRVISSYATGGQTATMFLFLAANGDMVGSVKSTVTATTYNTSSDQRLKENIADADDAGSKIDAIQVRQYDWKVDGSHQDYGMIAQELQAVAPEAVSGDADSEDMMGVDYSKLVPMLIKEIQSLRNRVAQLEE